MGKVHRVIEDQGQLIARNSGDFDRREIEAAITYMADEDNGIGFLGWCQAALPHRRLPNGKGWQIAGRPDINLLFDKVFNFQSDSCHIE